MYGYLAVAIILLIIGHIFKTIRWKKIIQTYEDVDALRLLRILAVSQSVNMVLPFRIGDLVRIVMLKKNLKNGYVLSIASVFIDLFIDTITVGMAFCALYILNIHRIEISDMAIIYGTLSLAVFVMLLILYSQRLCFKRLLYRIASLFNDDIERRLLMASYTVFSSAAKLVARGKIVQIGSVTAGVWLCYFLSYGFFALFLQWHNFDFTLTRVFKTIFSLRGDSLFAAMFTKNITWTYGTWFVMYLIIPIFIRNVIWISPRQPVQPKELP